MSFFDFDICSTIINYNHETVIHIYRDYVAIGGGELF